MLYRLSYRGRGYHERKNVYLRLCGLRVSLYKCDGVYAIETAYEYEYVCPYIGDCMTK